VSTAESPAVPETLSAERNAAPQPQAAPQPSPARRSLVVKATAGRDAPERCAQAFTVAASAAAAGVPVSMWLTGEASWFALPGRADAFELPHSAPLAGLLATVLAAGTLTLCTQCAARRDITPGDVIPGIRIAGASTFVEECLVDGTQALVY
jgi:predicted peroxiredoxin